MRIIHSVNYDVTAQLEFRKIIYQNILKVNISSMVKIFFDKIIFLLSGHESVSGCKKEIEYTS